MRRKISTFLIFAVGICMLLVPLQAMAEENTSVVATVNSTPVISSISFKNATIDGDFKPDVREYGLTLDDNEISPTLENYVIYGDADIYITYTYDEANHQIGLTATLQYELGSTIYNFKYTNPAQYQTNDNNLLSEINCTYGELVPAINDEDTAYKLYIPSDLTQLTITPVTEDINAYSAPIELTLDDTQTPKITLYCTASNGSKREYLLEIKRVDKTTEQVKAEMASPDYTSFVDGTRIYQKTEFTLAVCAIIGGIIVLVVLFLLTKRIAVNPYDKDEKPFYTPVE